MIIIILIAIIIFAPRTNNNSASTDRTNSNTSADTAETVDTAVPELPTDTPELKPTENREQAKIACNAWLQEATLIISDLQAGEISSSTSKTQQNV